MPKNLREWLFWLIKLRIVALTTLLGVSLGMASVGLRNEAITGLFRIILATSFVSVFHYLCLRHSSKCVWQAYFQTACDLCTVSCIVYVTGGTDSYFSFLYLLSIIMSSILLYRKGALITATASSLLIMGQHLSVQAGLLPATTFASTDPNTTKFIIGINIFAFYAVALLSSHMSESLRRTGTELEDKRGKLANLQAFNENIINSMRGGLFTTDLTGTVTLFNRSACEITGYRPERVVGTHVKDIFGFSEIESQNFGSERLPMRFEKSVKNASGEEAHLGFTISQLLVEQDRHVGYVFTFQDLSEIRKLERQIQQKDRLAAVGRMAAGIAHEIRNPLTAISGSFQLLKSELALNEDQNHLAENISLEVKRLYGIITDFLSYAKPIKYSPRLVDLKRLTEDTIDLFENSPELSAAHTIECCFDPDDSWHCYADADLIKQVFWNLCNNAVKAMPKGGVLSIGLEKARPGLVEISFRDTGTGLSLEEQEKIFEPFQSSFDGGTGLGLSIVSQIVEAHCGSIEVASREGIGTTFRVLLPSEVNQG